MQPVHGHEEGFKYRYQQDGADAAGEAAVVQAEAPMDAHHRGHQACVQEARRYAAQRAEVPGNLAQRAGKAEPTTMDWVLSCKWNSTEASPYPAMMGSTFSRCPPQGAMASRQMMLPAVGPFMGAPIRW